MAKKKGPPQPPPPDPDQGDFFQPPKEEPREPRGWEGMHLAHERLETYRAQMVAKLRQAAWTRWEETHLPVSVNDIRHVLDEEHYEGDPRILGVVFRGRWTRVNYDMTDAPRTNFGKTSSLIGLFVPKEFAMREI